MSLKKKILYKNRFAKYYFHLILKTGFLRRYLYRFMNSSDFNSNHDLYNHAKEYILQYKIKLPSTEVELKYNNSTIRIPVQEGYNHNIGRTFSFLGHDQEIKETYIDLVNNDNIKCFYDVGSNYGQHSILMLSQNLKVYCFEPNPSCHEEFVELAIHNEYKNYSLIKNAVGNISEKANLIFPKNSTWLGKIDTDSKDRFDDLDDDVITQEVEIITLDEFSKQEDKPELIKIDTEGFEIKVLQGAINLIDNLHPHIIFESLGHKEDITSIANFFFAKNYSIFSLPISKTNIAISNIESIIGTQGNFLAIHESKLEIIVKIQENKQ